MKPDSSYTTKGREGNVRNMSSDVARGFKINSDKTGGSTSRGTENKKQFSFGSVKKG